MSACTYKCVHFNSDYLAICTQHSRYEHNAVLQHPNSIIFYSLQSVTTSQMREPVMQAAYFLSPTVTYGIKIFKKKQAMFVKIIFL